MMALSSKRCSRVMMTSLKSGKTGKSAKIRGRGEAARACAAWRLARRCLVRRSGRSTRVAAREHGRSYADDHQLRHADDSHHVVVTATDPQAQSDEELSSADPAATQL